MAMKFHAWLQVGVRRAYLVTICLSCLIFNFEVDGDCPVTQLCLFCIVRSLIILATYILLVPLIYSHFLSLEIPFYPLTQIYVRLMTRAVDAP